MMCNQHNHEIRSAIEKTTSFVNALCLATVKHIIEWQCINCTKEKYDHSLLYQKVKIVKYQFCPKESEISTIYLTVDKQNDTYNLELEFSDQKGIICEMPTDNACKDSLKDLCEAVDESIELSFAQKINVALPTFIQSLCDKSDVV
ncbi:MAG: hypothetical protein NC401_06500 [Ruminococcus sp.]|nr:hypothetical protein [Ruminococcus sp.]